MKELTKLRLINWHLFANDTVDIKNITFLTGSNGTGKSTIIDAMQVVLLGDTSGRNFNKAANDKTGRTLRGYLRCETGETADGQVLCLRPGRFTSYIALGFKDTNTQEDFTLGIVFDCYPDDKEEHHFFYLKNKFPENNFTNKDHSEGGQVRALSYKELLEFFNNNYSKDDFCFYNTNLEYTRALKTIFGDLPDKYFSLFKKAVSFSPIINISNFITEFVCDIDYNVDISSMQQNIENYKILELEAKRMQVKIDELNKISEAFNQVKEAKSQIGLANYVADRANYEDAKARLEEKNKAYQNNLSRLEDIARLLIEKDNQINELKREQEAYLAKKVGSAGFSLSKNITDRKDALNQKIADLNNNYNLLSQTLKHYLSQYNNAINALNSRLNNLDSSFLTEREIEELSKFREIVREFSSTALEVNNNIDIKNLSKNLLVEFQDQMSSLRSSSLKFSHLLENSIANLNDQQDELNRDLSNISSGQKPFSQNYLEIKAALKNSLLERHSNAKVDSFCDLIDISDKKWTPAIEGVIFNQKFNFIVNDEYYNEASKLLDRIEREYNIFNFSVVDTSKLIDKDFQADENSLAEEIISDHQGAKAYANFLLGRIQKCDTFEEARQSGNGLTASGLGYRNFASYTLASKKTSTYFIGTKVSDETSFAKKEDYNEILHSFELYQDLLSYVRSFLQLEVLSTTEVATMIKDVEGLSEINTLNDELERLDQQLHEGDLNEVSQYDKKLEAIKVDIQALEEEKHSLYSEQGVLEDRNKELATTLIPNARLLVDQYGANLNDPNKYDPNIVAEKYEPFFAKAFESLPFEKLKSESRMLYIKSQNSVNNSLNKLKDLRARYVITYHLSYDPNREDSNEEFDKELNNLSTVLLPDYLSKIEAAKKKATKEFKDDFIYKLRSCFETIKSQIDELNLALKDVKFGRDSYQFKVSPNKDYIEYYDMITDDLLLNIGDAEEVYLEKYGPVMTNLFNMISDSTLETKNADQRQQIIANVEKFTNYTTYLNFDLLVKRGESNDWSSLARTFKRQSGGETQTPFYISILASFAQLYRTNDPNSDSIRLVIFDEAFSKMDGSRIKESVSLLRSFGLQAILSTPTEKVTDLVNEVDLTLVVMHDQKHNRSRIDRYQDKRKLVNNNIQA